MNGGENLACPDRYDIPMVVLAIVQQCRSRRRRSAKGHYKHPSLHLGQLCDRIRDLRPSLQG